MSDAAALPVAEPVRRQPLMRLASDTRLAKLAAAGSTPAFTAIYERHHQEIYRYCRSILTSDEDARDALQNTMLKAMRALEGEAREISLRPWLFRIAHNEAVSLVRRRRPDTSLSLAEELPATGTDFTARQRLRDLIADLEQLTERQKSALVMRELSGLEFEEIAVALETSPEAAKQSVYEARVALQQLEQGRDMDCVDARKKLSAEDGRLLRGRQMRGHLKNCADCRAFKQAISSRRGQLAMIAPPLPMGIAIHLLDGILGGGGSGGGGAAAGAGGGAIGAAGTTGGGATGFGAAGLGVGALAKVGLAGAIALGTGAMAVEVGKSDPGTPWERAAEAAVAGGTDTLTRNDRAGTTGAERPAGQGPDGRAQTNGESGAGAAGAGGGDPAAGPQAQGSDQAPGGVGAAPGSPSHQGTTPSAAPVAGAGGPPDSAGPAGTPPGQGGTPPGQGGTPPGLEGTPPGQGGSPPGLDLTPPGQGGSPPGQGVTPPGQGVTPPGQGVTPPGQGVTPPGQGGATPGQGGGTPPGLDP